MKLNFKMNIRNKFLVPTIILIIVGMGVSSLVSYTKSKSALNQALLDNIQQRAESTAVILQSWIKDRTLDLNSWRLESIYAKATLDSFMGKAARITVNKKLMDLKQAYGYYEDIFMADSQGNIVASSAKATIGKIQVGDRAYFKAAMEGQVHVSQAAISRNSGHPIFVIAAPVEEKGQVKGVLAGVVDITSFSEKFIDPIKVGESGYAYLAGQDGVILAHPVKENISKLNLNEFDFGKKMMAEKEGQLEYVYEGQPKWASFKTLDDLGWKIAVNVLEKEILAPVTSLGRINMLVAVIVVVIAMALIFVVTSSVVKPVNRVVAGLKDAAEGEGDLTKRIEISSNDEVAELARWFNTFVEKIQRIISDVAENAANLSSASKDLSNISEHLSNSAEQTSGKAVTVASASEEMSVTVSSAAQTMGEMASNLTVVASGAEEMTATIGEIAVNTEKGRQIADEAVGQTSHASRQIEELGVAAQQIGKVVETITEISEQVNLLALNATIEAARAGEAGKGFAVVANEIKDLAKQTAAASGEIKQQVEGIQNSTQGTVAEITSIASVVAKVNEIVTTIATAVEEQSVTTKDIAGNVARASEGVGEVNNSIAESSQVANTITADITDVTEASGEISNSSSQVNSSSRDLSRLADKLNSMVGQFKV
jgi:methyl-accepting chemotaxis protein